MNHLTNLTTRCKGWNQAPSWSSLWPSEIPHGRKFVMLDDEMHEGVLNTGIPEGNVTYGDAIVATNIVVKQLRIANPGVQVGFFAMPGPMNASQIELTAQHAMPLVTGSFDVVMPCAYYRGDDYDHAIERATWIRDAIEMSGGANLERIGVVSDTYQNVPADSSVFGQPCDPDEIEVQCDLARHMGCKRLYLWSTLDLRLKQALSDCAPDNAICRAAKQFAIWQLAQYDIRVSTLTKAEAKRAVRERSEKSMVEFAEAWEDSRNS